jgi:hypothetical protein
MSVRREKTSSPTLVELIRRLQDQQVELPAALHELAVRAVHAVPGAQYGGISIVDHDGTVESFVATHPYASLLDKVQQTRREGPCFSDAGVEHAIKVNDLARDDRWPRYRRDVLGRTPIACGPKANATERNNALMAGR